MSSRRRWILSSLAIAAALGVLGWRVLGGKAQIRGATSEQRIESIGRLAAERPRGAADALAPAALDDPDATVRQAALVALGRWTRPADRAVFERATGDADAGVRAAAAESMGFYGDAATVGHLLALATRDGDLDVRLSAVRGLGRVAGRESTLALLGLMEQPGPPAVRLQALETLSQRLGVQFTNTPSPADARGWEEVLKWVRRMPVIRRAQMQPGATP